MKCSRRRPRALAWPRALLLLLATVAGACSSGSAAHEEPFFPATFRQAGFRRVRACRAPGEHSGLNGFTVWADDASADVYDSILAASGDVHQMPAGAIVVKELYDDRTCSEDQVDRWVAMKKVPGYDPANGDWMWQDVTGRRTLTSEGRVASCSACHAGGDDMTCAGYGELHGMDYLCTAP